MQTTAPEIGDFLPDFRLIDHRGKGIALLWQALGKPIVLLVCRDFQAPGARGVLADFIAQQAALTAAAHLFAVDGRSVADNAALAEEASSPDFPLLSDPPNTMAAAFAPEGVTCVIADANRRILRIDRQLAGPDQAAAVLSFLEAQPQDEPQVMGFAAPVLTVPQVLDPAFCQRLIERHGTASGQTGLGQQVAGGVLDSSSKVRRDHIVTDPALHGEIGGLIGRRVVPEIFRAFNYRVSYVKEFKICCYEAAEGGFFKPHRDNIEPKGGRRFAMTLNLNTGDYEGGQLRFPEYGPHLYSPAAGAAVIFACNLVHEVLPVTAGRRYVLLSFFYGDEDG